MNDIDNSFIHKLQVQPAAQLWHGNQTSPKNWFVKSIKTHTGIKPRWLLNLKLYTNKGLLNFSRHTVLLVSPFASSAWRWLVPKPPFPMSSLRPMAESISSRLRFAWNRVVTMSWTTLTWWLYWIHFSWTIFFYSYYECKEFSGEEIHSASRKRALTDEEWSLWRTCGTLATRRYLATPPSDG